MQTLSWQKHNNSKDFIKHFQHIGHTGLATEEKRGNKLQQYERVPGVLSLVREIQWVSLVNVTSLQNHQGSGSYEVENWKHWKTDRKYRYTMIYHHHSLIIIISRECDLGRPSPPPRKCQPERWPPLPLFWKTHSCRDQFNPARCFVQCFVQCISTYYKKICSKYTTQRGAMRL